MMKKERSPSRPRTALMAWIVLVATAVALAPPIVAQPAAESDAWITTGADAWQVLLASAESRRMSLTEVERLEGVVLARVAASDLPAISVLFHRELHRCPGFIRHRDLADAREALTRRPDSLPRVPEGGYTIDQGATVLAVTSILAKPQILDTITHLSTSYNNRFHQHPSGLAAAQWIHDRWATYAAGRSDVTTELVSHPGINQPSVVLTIRGVTEPDEVVVLGGHLDSVSFDGGSTSNPDFIAPGADDNASGIAVLTEVIRVAMETGFRPERTVSFMGYAAEEVGLLGSQDIAGDYAAAAVDVVAVLQLDMTDYNGSTEDVGLLSDHTDATLTAFVADLIDTYQPSLLWTSTACGYACSDHASWTAEGFPAAMSFEARVGQHNPFIHTTNDTLATLNNNVDHAMKFARLAAAFMVEIAKAADIDLFADGFESGDTSAWSATVP